MRIFTTAAIIAISIGSVVPASAQMAKNGNPIGAMPAMSAADQRTKTRCEAMTHERMMKNARCQRLMRMHPEAITHDGMQGGMMPGAADNHNGTPAGSVPPAGKM